VIWAGGAPLIVHNCENLTQAAARDVLAGSMPAVEKAGYPIILTVHDELVTETPDSPEFTADGLAEIMARSPEWAPDIPLAAAGFEARRYRK
jgi:DNA polymerase bacteriophage-type